MSRQNPQNTLFWLGWLTAVRVCVPVVRLKAIGSPPMPFPGGGGQSWLVGKPAFSGLAAGVHALPLFGPPWQRLGPPHVPPLGQSVFELHGPPSFVPPVHVALHTGQTWM